MKPIPFSLQKEVNEGWGCSGGLHLRLMSLSLLSLWENSDRISWKQRGFRDHSSSPVLTFVFRQLNPFSQQILCISPRYKQNRSRSDHNSGWEQTCPFGLLSCPSPCASLLVRPSLRDRWALTLLTTCLASQPLFGRLLFPDRHHPWGQPQLVFKVFALRRGWHQTLWSWSDGAQEAVGFRPLRRADGSTACWTVSAHYVY